MSANAAVTHVGPDTDPTVIAGHVAAHGVVIVDDLLPLMLLDQFADEIAPHIEANTYGPDDFSGRLTRRTGSLIARSRAAREIAAHPTVLAVAAQVIDAQKYQLHLTQVISISPGQRAQPMHRDQWAWDQFPFPAGREVELAAIWAMTEFTEENGATHVMPGSHLDDDRAPHPRSESVQAVMRRGSVLLYTGSTFHAGGENRSDAVRHALQFVYCAAWLRQEENQYLSTPPEVARELPDDLLRLMGYDLASYSLGYAGDIQHPLDALRGTDRHRGFGDDLLLPAAKLR
jgi:ectoine hydroxylase-related dioxygenase (phytanoyl-CoA dioxygenase family)